MRNDIDKIFDWIEENYGIIIDDNCSCCKSNEIKYEKFVKYLNKLNKKRNGNSKK